MFCCGVALCSDATCPTMSPAPCPRTRVLFPLLSPFSPSAQSRVVCSSSLLSPSLCLSLLCCLPRILLHFYSCWRACFAAIASFAAMSWPCCMWQAGRLCGRGGEERGRVKMYTLHLNHSGKLLLAAPSLYLSAAIYLQTPVRTAPLPASPSPSAPAKQRWLQLAAFYFIFFLYFFFG